MTFDLLNILLARHEAEDARHAAAEPLTRGGPDRRYRKCRCVQCGRIGKCTPEHDYYTLAGDDLGPLHCEVCFRPIVRQRLTEVTP